MDTSQEHVPAVQPHCVTQEHVPHSHRIYFHNGSQLSGNIKMTNTLKFSNKHHFEVTIYARGHQNGPIAILSLNSLNNESLAVSRQSLRHPHTLFFIKISFLCPWVMLRDEETMFRPPGDISWKTDDKASR